MGLLLNRDGTGRAAPEGPFSANQIRQPARLRVRGRLCTYRLGTSAAARFRGHPWTDPGYGWDAFNAEARPGPRSSPCSRGVRPRAELGWFVAPRAAQR